MRPVSTKVISGLNMNQHADKICQGPHSLSSFAEYQRDRLLRQMFNLANPCREELPDSGQDYSRCIKKLGCLGQACTALRYFSRLDKQTEEEIHYQQLVKKAFEQFSSRILEQQKILECGALVLQIRSALLKMRAVRHLRIDNGNGRLPIHFGRRTQVSSDFSSLDDEELLEYLSGRQAFPNGDLQYATSSTGAISLIPALLVDLGTINFRRLLSLEIDMSESHSFKGLSAADTTYSKIGAAVQNLKTFRFIHRGPVMPPDVDEIMILRKFLNSIINVASLESLNIRTNLWDQDTDVFDPEQSPQISLIKARTDWPNLSSVLLDTLHIEHSDLTHLLSFVNSGQGYVGLHRIHLIDGQWATVLDLLKERHSWSDLNSPSGAECEDMSEVQYERIFGPYSTLRYHTVEEEVLPELQEAVSYIRGWQEHNPLNLSPVINQS